MLFQNSEMRVEQHPLHTYVENITQNIVQKQSACK